MDNNVKVLITLLENEGKNISISQLSNCSKIDYKNTYNIVKQLEKEHIINLEKFGNAFNCILNKKLHPLIFEAEYERRKKLLKNTDLQILHKKINSLNFSFIALLFGSYAKGTSSKNSDIDLMIVSETNREKDVERVISLLPLDIHLIFFTYEEFLSMALSKEFSVVLEAIKRNVILIGIEDYYRLMANVG